MSGKKRDRADCVLPWSNGSEPDDRLEILQHDQLD